MKRRTFISLMSVMAAAGVLTLAGCSSNSGSSAAASGAASSAASTGAADQLASIQANGKLVVALEGAWQPWSYHDESDTLVGYDVEVSRAIAEKLGVEPEYVGLLVQFAVDVPACSPVWTQAALTWCATAWK